MFKSDILFILKKNQLYSFVSYTRRSSGLWNSTRFIKEAMVDRGLDAHIVEVNDNNDIDREVHKHRPKIVVIEALWVVPEKFEVLKRLHPNVKWAVHMHSDMPFLALEGNSMKWLRQYAHDGLDILANSPESFDCFKMFLPHHRIKYLPNVYIPYDIHLPHVKTKHEGELNVACFGAVRPMKNHLMQACAAIKFAKQQGLFLKFHINGTRTEVGGDPVLKNLRQLFEGEPNAKLVEEKWHEPEDLIKHMRFNIDIGMQVSMTETFNVVTADYVTAGLPIVVSDKIKWVSCWNKADDESPESVLRVMHRVWRSESLVLRNQSLLVRYANKSKDLWQDYILQELDK